MLSLFVGGAYAANVVRISDVVVDGYPEISAVVSVTDKTSGASVTGLAASDFALSIDGKPASIIESESALTQVQRVAVAIVIDGSGSMRGGPVDAAKSAASDMMGRLCATDSACVVGFAGRVTCECSFTSDRTVLRKALGRIDANGNTALYDAVIMAAKCLSKQQSDRKAVVLLTDGVDTKSTSSYDVCEKTAADLGVAVYAIGLGRNVSHDQLDRLAQTTGGRYCRAASASELQAIYQSIAKELRNRYTIIFQAPMELRSGSWHDLVVVAGGAQGKKRFMAALGPRGAYGGSEVGTPDALAGGIVLLGLANAAAVSAYSIKRHKRRLRNRRL